MSQPLIFVTGATGFIGAHAVAQALEAGYQVRLSVRKEAQIDSLCKLFSEHAANLDFVVVPDFSSPDAFGKALQGVTNVFHIASPMPGKGDDFESDYLKPAVEGTIALLNAAKKANTIKRVIVVSSILALVPAEALVTRQFIAKEGLNATIQIDPKMSFPEDARAASALKYHASKVLAHRATLEWAASQSSPLFSLITLHPSWVFGRNLTQASAADLDGTNAMLWRSLTNEKPTIPMAAVDVRDVAAAHVKALDVNADKGRVEEFILSAGEKENWTWEKVTELVRRKYAFVGVKLQGPFGGVPSADTSKAQNVLGIKWRSMEDTIGSFLEQQSELRRKF